MSKISKIILICIVTIIISGCSTDEKILSNGKKVNTNKMQVMHCTRTASAGSGIEVDLKYDLYYNGEDLNILHSTEKVITASDESLDTYENAYKGIHKNYEGLEYYDASVTRTDTTVTSDITINYEKIDIDALLKIEGEEDNIIENGKAKVDKWLTLAKKLGTKCEEEE